MKIETGNNFFPSISSSPIAFERERETRIVLKAIMLLYHVLPRWWRSHFLNERAYFETMDENDERTSTIRVNRFYSILQ